MNNISVMEQGYKVKLDFEGNVKVCRVTNLYGMLTKIKQNFEEIHG